MTLRNILIQSIAVGLLALACGCAGFKELARVRSEMQDECRCCQTCRGYTAHYCPGRR